MTPEQRQAVLDEAHSWLGTPYHHQAKNKGAGVDCAMILVDVYHQAGLIPQIDPRPYPPDWHMHRDAERYLGWISQYADEVHAPLPGDIAVFQFGRCVSHAAIVVDWPLVIHAFMPAREVVLSDIGTSADLTNRLRGFYRIR